MDSWLWHPVLLYFWINEYVQGEVESLQVKLSGNKKIYGPAINKHYFCNRLYLRYTELFTVQLFWYHFTEVHVLRAWLAARSLQWRHNGHDSISNHQPRICFLNHLFRRRSKKTSKLRVTGLCAWNSPGTCEFPPQMASNAENVSIWWRHHVIVGKGK